jgi:hypothetical protein
MKPNQRYADDHPIFTNMSPCMTRTGSRASNSRQFEAIRFSILHILRRFTRTPCQVSGHRTGFRYWSLSILRVLFFAQVFFDDFAIAQFGTCNMNCHFSAVFSSCQAGTFGTEHIVFSWFWSPLLGGSMFKPKLISISCDIRQFKVIQRHQIYSKPLHAIITATVMLSLVIIDHMLYSS